MSWIVVLQNMDGHAINSPESVMVMLYVSTSMSKGAYPSSMLRRKYSSTSSTVSLKIRMTTHRVSPLPTLKKSWKKFPKSMPPVKREINNVLTYKLTFDGCNLEISERMMQLPK